MRELSERFREEGSTNGLFDRRAQSEGLGGGQQGGQREGGREARRSVGGRVGWAEGVHSNEGGMLLPVACAASYRQVHGSWQGVERSGHAPGVIASRCRAPPVCLPLQQ